MNIDKAIEKLEQILHSQEKDGVVYRITFDDLREILLAGKEPLAHEIMLKEATERMQREVKKIEELEKRVSQLESLAYVTIVKDAPVSAEDMQRMYNEGFADGKKDAPAVDSQLLKSINSNQINSCKPEPKAVCDCKGNTAGKAIQVNNMHEQLCVKCGEPVKIVTDMLKVKPVTSDKITIDRAVAEKYLKYWDDGNGGYGQDSSEFIITLRNALKEQS